MSLVELGRIARGELFRCFLVIVSAQPPYPAKIDHIVPVPLLRGLDNDLARIDLVSLSACWLSLATFRRADF